VTRKGFDPDKHRRFLVRLLVDIGKEFGARVGFKGGSCAAMFYDLPRLSLDLDFDALATLTNPDIDTLRGILGARAGLRDFKDKAHTLFFLVDYERDAPNIKVEINKRTWRNNRYRDIWFMGILIKIADEGTLLTNKLVALTNRKVPAARDLFDTNYFLKAGFPLNADLIVERTGKSAKDYLEEMVAYIERVFTEKNVLSGLGEVLDEAAKEWVRKELKSEVVREIRKLVEKIGRGSLSMS